VVAILTVSWLIMAWSDFLSGSARFHVPAGIAFFCLLSLVLYDILVLLLRVRQTDLDLLSAAVAAYFLLGVAWAVSFEVIERIMPGSFNGLDPGAVVGVPVLQHGDTDHGRLRRHHLGESARGHLGDARGCLRRALRRRADLASGRPGPRLRTRHRRYEGQDGWRDQGSLPAGTKVRTAGASGSLRRMATSAELSTTISAAIRGPGRAHPSVPQSLQNDLVCTTSCCLTSSSSNTPGSSFPSPNMPSAFSLLP
jgi:hypothetical protein